MFEKYKYYLPTYEECRAICDKYDNFNFYESSTIVDGYKISMFNYRLVKYDDYLYPLGKDNPLKANELRGICYVFDTDGSLYKRFLLMEKFFNLNQVEETQLHNIKHIPIRILYDKCDGSIINFIQLPNGKILTKSKMCVDNFQALQAFEIYEKNIHIKEMVDYMLSRNIMPIMEYISPRNRVVLKYTESKLVLLKFRDLVSGEYYDLDIYPKINLLDVALEEDLLSWEVLLEISKTIKGKEGWVATLEDGRHVKQKTDEYFSLHHAFESIVGREDFMIQKIVDEEIDDIIGQLELEDTEILTLVNEVSDITNDYIKRTVLHVETLLEKYKNYTKKDIVSDYGKVDKYLSYLLATIDGNNILLDVVCKDLKKNTYRLEKAREFIKNGGNF